MNYGPQHEVKQLATPALLDVVQTRPTRRVGVQTHRGIVDKCDVEVERLIE